MVAAHRDETLRTAGRWLGVGIATGPAFDIADRYGLITSLANPGSFPWAAMLRPVALIVMFVLLGSVAARLLRQHRARGRSIFFAACAAPLALWVLYTGLRAATVVPILALVLVFARLRTASRLGC